MRLMKANLARLLGLVAVVLMVVAAGCGGGGGSAAGQADLSDADLTIGSKEFTEQLILGQITLQALEAAGATVNDQTGLAGTVAAREALEAGEIDMYWEYTGTAWITHLGETEALEDRQEQFDAVAQRDLEENSIQWLAPPSPANNTYAIAVRTEAAEELGVATLTDIGQVIEENPEEATICVGTEFSTRDDGLPGLEEAYGFKFPEDNVVRIDEGQIYQETDRGERCNFGEVFQTDGRIQALDLTLLEDDKRFFPNYNPALAVRQEVMDQYPGIEEVFAPISEALTTEELQELNRRVDVDGELPDSVAEDWLSEKGFV